jgi:hypothetical protein
MWPITEGTERQSTEDEAKAIEAQWAMSAQRRTQANEQKADSRLLLRHVSDHSQI